MRNRLISTRRSARVIVVIAVLSLVVLIIPAAGSAGEARVTEGEARGAAFELIERVLGETLKNPGAPGTELDWNGAHAGDPLLIYDMEGRPSEYIVPVLDSTGKTVSVIGIGAADGQWHWYSEYTHGRFPLVDTGTAVSRAKGFLKSSGIEADAGAPVAKMASDKTIYWTFDISDEGPIRTVYLPAFIEGKAYTNLKPPWKEEKTLRKVDIPADGSGTGSSSAPAAQVSYPGGAPSAYNIPDVPYHAQTTNYWCGPASLEMVFDYFGPDINQAEIASVANSNPAYGCYNTEVARAGQFSSQSTSVQNPGLQGYTGRDYGYGMASASWKDGTALYDRRYSDLKNLISQDIPVMTLMWYDGTHSSGHFRVAKGYNDTLGTIIFHDPWYSGTLSGPDVSLNQNFFVDNLWNYSDRWGMIACPFKITLDKPVSVNTGQVFSVTAKVYYVGPDPFDGQYPCQDDTVSAIIRAATSDYDLVGSQTNQRVYGMEGTGTFGTATWTVQSLKDQNTDDISVDAQGLITGSTSAYPSYQDWIGGTGSAGEEAPVTSRTWAHDSIGVPNPSETWYLAEGSTRGGFETWILVQNPNDEDADVSLTYMTADGEEAGPTVTIGANSRTTFFVGDTVADTWSVSTKVESDQPVIAERSMYGNNRTWGHDSIGVTDPAETWYLAEGCTNGGFETWILVQNPNDSAAEVTLTYMTADGKKTGPTVELPANSRQTFFAADSVPDNWDVSTLVTSDKPVIAERAMYGNNRTWGHDSVGVSETVDTWYLAEGCTNGGFETWVLVQNPNDSPAEVELTYMTADGPVDGPTVTIDSNSRQSFDVSETVPSTWAVSTEVSSDLPVIAERAMYGNNRTWGHDSRGVSLSSNTWYLAEGCTNTGFETWILVQNPNMGSADVTLTFMTPDGAIEGPTMTLQPDTRYTFNVGNYVPGEWEVSTLVNASLPVIAERAMYGDPL
ncbi:MAG: C39 family peptidase [Actinobacteria bacterium]|nr:C39 family peptidase [Actinomycetota bacterium]